jgi:uncharacterized protein (TIGR02996 family)
MSHEGFLGASRERPEDDAPRLIYADWLEEHGQSDRAEFIRLQIELAPLDLDDPRRSALKDREVELMTAHRGEWLEDLVQIAAAECWWFHRGFPAGLEWQMRFSGDTIVHALASSSSPYLATLTELELGANHITADGARALAFAPHLAGLKVLSLWGNPIGDGGMRALASSPYLTALTELNLAGNDIGEEGFRAFATSPNMARLTKLNLNGNPIGVGGRLCVGVLAVPNILQGWCKSLCFRGLSAAGSCGAGSSALPTPFEHFALMP